MLVLALGSHTTQCTCLKL